MSPRLKSAIYLASFVTITTFYYHLEAVDDTKNNPLAENSVAETFLIKKSR